MSHDQESAYQPGQIIAGKYRVDRTLGVGGFGVVVAATHMQLEERVAIKILLPEAAKNPAAAERFLREAKAAVRIRSEHVARVTDVGTFSASDGSQTPYMVMEYLEGCDLSTLVKTRGAQQIHDVCEFVMQACEAIAEAHALGIVHRDLKPANLFLTHRVDGAPCIKVLDFGISKITTTNEADKGMTKSSDVMGSPYYMSPEQMRSTRAVDARSDIWALGAILYELVAGAPPFDGETMTALIVNIMQEAPRDLLSRRSDLPRPLHETILRCLQKDPGARFQDVSALAYALAPFAPARAQGGLSRVSAALHGAQTPGGSRGSRGSLPNATVPGAPAAFGGSQPFVGSQPVSGHPVSSHPMGAPASMPPSGSVPPMAGEEPVPPTVIPGVPYQHSMGAGSASHPPTLIGGVGAPAATAMGLPLGVSQVSQVPPQAFAGTFSGQQPKPSRTPLIVGLSAIVIGAVAASGFIVMRERGGQTGQQSAGVVALPTTTTTSTTSTAAAATATPPPTASAAPVVAPAETSPAPGPVSKPGQRPPPQHASAIPVTTAPPPPPPVVTTEPPPTTKPPPPTPPPPPPPVQTAKPGLFDTPH